MDDLDIQARETLKFMMKGAGNSKNSVREKTVFKLLEQWNFRFDQNSVGASIYAVWEFQIASHLHETQIKGVKARRAFAYTGLGEHFVNRQLKQWSEEKETMKPYCLLFDL